MAELQAGAYEQLVTETLEEQLSHLSPDRISRASLEPADAHEVLGRYLASVVNRALLSTRGTDNESISRQVRLANEIARAVEALSAAVANGDLVSGSNDLLLAIARDEALPPGAARFPQRPEVPLSSSALLVNARLQPRIGTEIPRELASADAVDLLCAFVKWHGLRLIDEHLEAFVRRGGKLRVITTTYMGATERRAIDRLSELGAEVKVSYETRMTRLHAKAWLFRRTTGFSTAYVGSSNLSKSALLDGLEWNVRLSAVEQGHLLDTFAATFEQYWFDPSFEPYDPTRAEDVVRLDEALAAEHSGEVDLPLDVTTLDVRPWGYQSEILDELEALRTLHGRWRNLVVMATGTGKTVVAGLDYRRLRAAGTVDTLLFVAHREEILRQSLSTFRHILRDGSFGEVYVAGERPSDWRHVFASVQSLAQVDLARDLAPDRFDMVIVDEFHHASIENRTYAAVLKHVRPKVLLGLTATPERADGEDIRTWFDKNGEVELRLWEALERGLLCPFQYFGIHDDVDLRDVTWRRGQGYDQAALTAKYTIHDGRVRLIAQALHDKVTSIARMRAIGFCVSIAHAEFMAARFNEIAGIAALAVTSRTPGDERRGSLTALRNRDVNVLFTVDLFNEGIDLPEIDTVLFLRPTESATIFLQQLGRGLRLADNKPCLTVFDFIGQQRAEFRFDLRFRAITGSTRRGLAQQVAQGFPTLPPGCHIELDRVSSDIVLQNVQAALRIDWAGLVAELRRIGPCSLAEFLQDTGLDLDDIYRRRRGGWTGLRRLAGIETRPAGDDDTPLANAIARLLHVDDEGRLAAYRSLLSDPRSVKSLPVREQRFATMLHFALWGANAAPTELDSSLARARRERPRVEELVELLGVLDSRRRHLVEALNMADGVPLYVHARYSRDEALAAFGVINPGTVRQGVRWVEAERADLFFVTLKKTEGHYSPTTMYQDRAVSPSLFQWESQSLTSEGSPTGQRYIHHARLGTSVHIFMRESRETDGDMGAPPYVYLGPATYISHQGERPMRILWHLTHPLPADVFHAAQVAVG